jgi:hypothetical protein
MRDINRSDGAPFLILAHPGHELRLFHWMEKHCPRVFVLSDGSGGAASARTGHSLRALAATGARAGEVFGQTPDRAWYATLLAGDPAPFRRIVADITAAARRERPALLVSDAVDGHNPLHDLCQAIGSAVAARLGTDGMAPRHQVAPATAGSLGRPAESWRLDASAAARKRAAVAAYAPLAEGARRILAAEPDALEVEQLLHPTFDWPPRWSPDWEAFGRQRVADGRFAQAITYAGHVLPLARAILHGGDRPPDRAAAAPAPLRDPGL